MQVLGTSGQAPQWVSQRCDVHQRHVRYGYVPQLGGVLNGNRGPPQPFLRSCPKSINSHHPQSRPPFFPLQPTSPNLYSAFRRNLSLSTIVVTSPFGFTTTQRRAACLPFFPRLSPLSSSFFQTVVQEKFNAGFLRLSFSTIRPCHLDRSDKPFSIMLLCLQLFHP